MTVVRSACVLGLAIAAGCSEQRASVTDVEQLYSRYPEAYAAVVEATLTRPREEGLPRRNSALFDDIETLPPFRWTGIRSEGEGSRYVLIVTHSYGMSVSGREVGLAFFVDGEPQDETVPEFTQRVFDTCAGMEAAYAAGEQASLGYCAIGGRWYAFQYSF